MAPEETGHASHEDSCKGLDISTEITDFNIDERNMLDEPVKLSEESAAYACRWIHLVTSHYTFREFTNIVHDLLLDHSSGDRNKILSRLQRIQRRQEIKTSDDPTFRPAFVSLYGDDRVEDILGIPDFEQAKSNLPAFSSIPTIHSDEPSPRICAKTLPLAKSLLQYHYRLGTRNNTFERPDPYFASMLDGIRAPCVREMWCLALDNTRLINSKPSRRALRIRKSLNTIAQSISTFLPAGMMLSQLLLKIQYNLLGVDYMDIMRLTSFFDVLHRSTEVKRIMSGQAEPPEEITHALRKLWSIAIRFTMNFHLSPDRQIYQLDLPGMWRGIIKYIRHDAAATSAMTELLYRLDGKSKKRETLQDLENELGLAIRALKAHYGTAHSKLEASRDNENKDMLRSIQPFQDNLSLACLLRMCTISTPTRFLITSQDIMDTFSVKISRLSLAQVMVNSMLVKADNGKTPETEKAHAPLCTGAEDSGHDQQTQIFNLLQRKSQLRHRKLAYDIERLQDATERLESQAALFIKVKAEDQSVAIYVFTLVTVVFLPLSFATSYMGMNTSDIRDMEQGQWVFWVVGGALTVAVLVGVWAVPYRGPRWKKARQTEKFLRID
ncbi:Mg2+ transporter -like Zinc transport [Fusarium acutatum]|uniref:Mg2+ transporter -like Zinc transport n=1 Tax=Fusarium acutatum TaxID=78861 RepID=A0A8H4K5B8_9HYPO|nr:Mg2+ transporter -like Zinc transport [Fusarium acutatum]